MWAIERIATPTCMAPHVLLLCRKQVALLLLLWRILAPSRQFVDYRSVCAWLSTVDVEWRSAVKVIDCCWETRTSRAAMHNCVSLGG